MDEPQQPGDGAVENSSRPEEVLMSSPTAGSESVMQPLISLFETPTTIDNAKDASVVRKDSKDTSVGDAKDSKGTSSGRGGSADALRHM